MRHATAADVDRLLRSFPDEDPEVALLRTRTHSYATECGCSTGGAFLVLAVIAAPVALTLEDAWAPLTVLWSLMLVVSASLAGKAAGVAVATVRLQLLRHSLRHQPSVLGGEQCPPAPNG